MLIAKQHKSVLRPVVSNAQKQALLDLLSLLSDERLALASPQS